jgi:hypothetical protein
MWSAAAPGTPCAPSRYCGMRKHLLPLALLFAALAGVAAYAAFALYQNTRMGFGWAGVVPVLPYVIAGTLTVGAVIVVFLWLAGYSERRGYDDRARSDRPR